MGPSLPPLWLGAAVPSQCSPTLLIPSFVPCSEKIHSAVTEMASLFPKVGGGVGPRGGGSPPGTVSPP